jgi:hypothetical protein
MLVAWLGHNDAMTLIMGSLIVIPRGADARGES